MSRSVMTIEQAISWFGYKFASTVLDDIWPLVLFFTGVATMVCAVTAFTSVDLSVNSTGLTVLGTIVSLVVSFKTNSSYARWWEGRNVWSNITSLSRQLAIIIWLQVPNTPPPHKEDEKDQKIPTSDVEVSSDQERDLEEHKKEYESLKGLVEKKTYVGLVQAFSVAVKHSLRGERGPFYSDLYGLISFLPKFNPSSVPPIHRDQLLVLWNNGLPREQSHHTRDYVAVPLTHPAKYTGCAFQSKQSPSPHATGDHERPPDGLTTSCKEFMGQILDSASTFCRDGNSCPEFLIAGKQGEGFCRVSTGDGRKSSGDVVEITTVELMPPRHPPAARYYDFFPPLRIFKIVGDWFRSQMRKEEDERQKGGKRRRGGQLKSEIPQEILMYLSAYVASLISRGLINSSLIGPTMTAINSLHQALTDLDKIATTPIPSAYTFHLRLTVYAYLFFLPFQLYQTLKWISIPATAIASVIYLGFLEIGAQIEEPFAYDQSDLDLDGFVLKIARQLAEVTAFPSTIPSPDIVLSNLNQPFLPTLSLSATDILSSRPIGTPPGSLLSSPPSHTSSSQNNGRPGSDNNDIPKNLPKSMRDLEMALNANWSHISDDTDRFMGLPKEQLENKTGLEVGVLLL